MLGKYFHCIFEKLIDLHHQWRFLKFKNSFQQQVTGTVGSKSATLNKSSNSALVLLQRTPVRRTKTRNERKLEEKKESLKRTKELIRTTDDHGRKRSQRPMESYRRTAGSPEEVIKRCCRKDEIFSTSLEVIVWITMSKTERKSVETHLSSLLLCNRNGRG